VGEDAFEFEAQKTFRTGRKTLVDVRGANAEAVHAGVNFEMEADRTLGQFFCAMRRIEMRPVGRSE